jgi:hypothetical protein
VLTQRPFCCRIISRFDLDRSSAYFALIDNSLKQPVANSIKDAGADIKQAVVSIQGVAANLLLVIERLISIVSGVGVRLV